MCALPLVNWKPTGSVKRNAGQLPEILTPGPDDGNVPEGSGDGYMTGRDDAGSWTAVAKAEGAENTIAVAPATTETAAKRAMVLASKVYSC
jgi:hypothetical protein